MIRIPLVLCATALLAAAGARTAAAIPFVESTPVSVGTSCPTPPYTIHNATSSFVGYQADPMLPFPQTGDIGYVEAVAVNISPCVNDAVGISVTLPLGASRNPYSAIMCYRGRLDGSITPVDIGPNASGGCSSPLAPGQYLWMYVPVDYQHELLGLGGPSSHVLRAQVSSAWGMMAPSLPLNVFYRPLFPGQTSGSLSPWSTTLMFTLYNYFVGGQLYVDFGPSPTSFGVSTPPAAVGSTYASAPVNVPLSGLSPNTTYYWRARYVTAQGTFVSPTQTFTTLSLNPTPLPGPRPCPRGGC